MAMTDEERLQTLELTAQQLTAVAQSDPSTKAMIDPVVTAIRMRTQPVDALEMRVTDLFKELNRR